MRYRYRGNNSGWNDGLNTRTGTALMRLDVDDYCAHSQSLSQAGTALLQLIANNCRHVHGPQCISSHWPGRQMMGDITDSVTVSDWRQ